MMFLLPLWRWMENILLGIMFVVFIISKEKIDLRNVLKYSSVLFFLYVVLRSFVDNQLIIDLSEIVRLIPLLLIPFAFNNLKKNHLEKGMFFMLMGILLMQLVSSIGIIEYYYFSEGKKIRLSNFARINDILYFERPYLGFFSLLSVILSYNFIKTFKNWIYVTPIFISLVLIIIISARLSFVLTIITLLIVIYDQIRNRVKLSLPIMLILIISSVYLIANKNSLIQRFYAIKRDSRTIIWKGAIQQIESTNSYLFGNGGQKEIREDLLIYYKNKAKFNSNAQKSRFTRVNYNTHNQYLNELIRGGFIGLFMLLFPIFILLLKNYKVSNIIPILLLFSIFSFGIVENILDRQKGVYLLGIILFIAQFILK